MATFQTYTLIGAKEDISDIISNISPTKTPFQSMIGKEKVTQKYFQWQEDSLRSVAANAQVEGGDPTDITVAVTTMRNGYTQIFWESVKVAGTVDATSTYGRAKESAYQMSKSAAAVKRDLEHALVGVTTSAGAGDATNGRTLGSAVSQVATGNVVTTGGTTKALDETHLVTCLQDVYTAGADPSIIMVTPSNSVVVAAFSEASGRYRVVSTPADNAHKIINVVNLYISPFGEQKVVLNRFLVAKYTLVFDPAMWSLVTLRPWTREVLAKTGDAYRQMIVGEFSLKHKNQSASGAVHDHTA